MFARNHAKTSSTVGAVEHGWAKVDPVPTSLVPPVGVPAEPSEHDVVYT